MSIEESDYVQDSNVTILFTYLQRKIKTDFSHLIDSDFYPELINLMKKTYARYRLSLLKSTASLDKKILYLNKKVVSIVIDVFSKAYNEGRLSENVSKTYDNNVDLIQRNVHFKNANENPEPPAELVTLDPEQLDSDIPKPDELLKRMEEQRISDKTIQLQPPNIENLDDIFSKTVILNNNSLINTERNRKSETDDDEQHNNIELMEKYIRDQMTEAHIEYQETTNNIELNVLSKLTNCIETLFKKYQIITTKEETTTNGEINEVNNKVIHEVSNKVSNEVSKRVTFCVYSSDRIMKDSKPNNYQIKLPFSKKHIKTIQLKDYYMHVKDVRYCMLDIHSNDTTFCFSHPVSETVVALFCRNNLSAPLIILNNNARCQESCQEIINEIQGQKDSQETSEEIEVEGNEEENKEVIHDDTNIPDEYILRIRFNKEVPEHTLVFDITGDFCI